MARYQIEMTISFSGEIEAESAEHAEQLAWTSWGDTASADITYDCVDDITVTELDEELEEEEEE